MTSDPRSDEQLMAAVGCRDMAALGELVRRHQGKVLAMAFRLLNGRWDLAEDTAQNTFLRVFHAAGDYQPSARFTTWLYRIVVNLCHDLRRKEGQVSIRLADCPDVPDKAPTQPRVDREEEAQRVRQWVAALPERQRTAVVLHRYQGLSHHEIAEITGWSCSAVESLLVRAYAQLRQEAEKWQKSQKGPQALNRDTR